ncbi:flavodoxin domain-containing protein [Sphingobium xenophagum]|uniref:flavodoxin domain-containing protein n=1 Tax=Sphingobium xenophagum TaxID=121428 RepID=UPI0003016BF7|nr:flavodoxin domain-containing protein [Sphingobium xenophagum]
MIEEPVLILVATVGGTATYVADEMADKLRAKGIKPFVVQMEKAALKMFETRKLFIICASTQGTGDLPDNAQPFFDALQGERPDLTGVRFGTVALGDMTYSASFCGGGRQFDEIFAELGATRIVERLEHDRVAGGYPEEAALEWLDGWLDAAAGNRVSNA